MHSRGIYAAGGALRMNSHQEEGSHTPESLGNQGFLRLMLDGHGRFKYEIDVVCHYYYVASPSCVESEVQ
jgi:hypothetical protein